jgi:parvulin-like peptidyl-prolyl isomerase
MKKLMLVTLVILFALSACENGNGINGGTADPDESPPPINGGNNTPPPLVLDPDGDTIALRVGDIEITSNEYRYHYFSAAQSIIGFYGAFMGIDPNQPFEEQYLDENMTWADFFHEQAVAGIRNSVILSEQAKKIGMTLDKSFEARITEVIDSMKDYCNANGIVLERLLNEYYGGNLDEQKLRAIMERTYLGYQFELYKRAGVDVSDAVLWDFYNENTADFDVVDYLHFMFDTAEEADDCLAAITNRQSFHNYIAEHFGEDLDEYLIIGDNNTGDEFADWLFDDTRIEGDSGIIDAYDVYFVLFFIRRYQPDDESLFIRHVLISSNGAPIDGGREIAEELYSEWKNGAATEETFAQLAREHSSCPSSSEGGLLEDVYEGRMVQAFNDWCFDPARRPGDTGLVDTEFGSHIVYYTGYVPGWKSRVMHTIIENVYSEFYEELLEEYQAVQLNTNVSR